MAMVGSAFAAAAARMHGMESQAEEPVPSRPRPASPTQGLPSADSPNSPAASGGGAATQPAELQTDPKLPEPFGYCLNTSTIRGQGLSLIEEIELAARVGYQAVEPWSQEIEKYVAEGGSLSDLAKRIADLGLSVAGVIGFAEWIVDDDERRARGLERARRDMEFTAALGGSRLAAPPAGAVDVSNMDLAAAARRLADLAALGESLGVTPQLELWGFSRTLSRLGELAYVAAECAHPNVLLLLDCYHLHKGGSQLAGLHRLNGAAMHVFHMNDYPAQPERAELTDAHRVYPGDGAAPLSELLRTLYHIGFRGVLSLELFNREYWQQPAPVVARTGLEKTREAVLKAFS
jgi:sugar phosphate isomerase/epimerase